MIKNRKCFDKDAFLLVVGSLKRIPPCGESGIAVCKKETTFEQLPNVFCE